MIDLRRVAVLATLLVLPAGCSGIDLSGGPRREVARETGPLTVPPHMRDEAHQ